MTDLDPEKAKLIKIRGRVQLVLPFVRMPPVFFHPNTPKKVVWSEQ